MGFSLCGICNHTFTEIQGFPHGNSCTNSFHTANHQQTSCGCLHLSSTRSGATCWTLFGASKQVGTRLSPKAGTSPSSHPFAPTQQTDFTVILLPCLTYGHCCVGFGSNPSPGVIQAHHEAHLNQHYRRKSRAWMCVGLRIPGHGLCCSKIRTVKFGRCRGLGWGGRGE